MSIKLLKTSLYFTVLSTLASAINFAFYPIISHTLSVANFGDVQLGVSFIMLAASLLTSLSTLALFATANRKTERTTLGSIERLVISISVIISIFTVTFAVPIASLLQLQDPSLLYILALIFILNIPASTWVGTLQGGGQFLTSGWISVISSLTKLSAAYLLINLGMGAYGALLGIALGSLVMLPLAKIFDRSNNIHYAETFGLFRSTDLSFFRRRKDLLFILGSLVMIALIANIDIVAAKILLSPDEAGAYAQVSTVAKIPYFAGIPIALVLFERYIKKNINYGMSLAVYAALIAVVGSCVIIFSNLLLHILFNYKGLNSELLFPLVTSFTAYSILILCAYQLIARKKTRRLIILATSSLVFILVLVATATTAPTIAHTYMFGVTTALLLSIGLTYTKIYE
jgi:O-antigen/teichoic acid export membrane protein